MKQPFFSVVIPTFNRSDLFPLAVRSILQQTFRDYEVVVSDNWSEDDTPRVAKQFTDSRVRYVRPPRHVPIADSWEFGRTQARGHLIIMLSDDDVLVSTALERFAREATRKNADFVFSRVGHYRDRSFPGPEKNLLECPAFSGSSRVVSVEEFVRPLYRFRPQFDMHPSAFAFSKAIADFVESRTGRFFWTNGVEFSAWPIAAVLAKQIVFIDAPLNILGRTGKSWGSNMALSNPGKERIQAFINDVDHGRKHAPLNNFTTSNLMAEGMLTAKSLFPAEFASFEFDEAQYLRATMEELLRRRSLGVDVAREIADATRYAQAKHPSVVEQLASLQATSAPSAVALLVRRARSAIRNSGIGALRRRLRAYQLVHRLRNGTQCSAFAAFGDDLGFDYILGCAEFLGRHVQRISCDLGEPPVQAKRPGVVMPAGKAAEPAAHSR